MTGPRSFGRLLLRPTAWAVAAVSRLVVALALVLVRGYQLVVSPLLHQLTGSTSGCRFHPTCSAYAAESLRRFGLVRGGGRALARVLRCHPFHPGGHDPVPPR